MTVLHEILCWDVKRRNTDWALTGDSFECREKVLQELWIEEHRELYNTKKKSVVENRLVPLYKTSIWEKEEQLNER